MHFFQACIHAPGPSAIDSSLVALPGKKKKKKPQVDRAVVQKHNCGLCGSSDHNRSTCPLATRDVQGQRLAVAESYRLAGAKAKAIARWKYTRDEQKSEQYLARPAKHSRAPLVPGGAHESHKTATIPLGQCLDFCPDLLAI